MSCDILTCTKSAEHDRTTRTCEIVTNTMSIVYSVLQH